MNNNLSMPLTRYAAGKVRVNGVTRSNQPAGGRSGRLSSRELQAEY